MTGALILFSLALVTPASAQQEDPAFVAEPTARSQTRGQGYFVIATEPGNTLKQAIYLRNDSGRPLTLELAAVDATTGAVGGVSYELPTDPRDAVGAWIRLERRSITLAAGEDAELTFVVEVPDDATTGEHLGGIAIWAPAEEEEVGAAPPGQAGASVSFQTRRILAVQVDLPGPAEPLLVVSGIAPVARADGVYLEIGIENQGHGLTKGEGVITLPDEGFRRDFSIDTFVPGTSIAYPIEWTVAADNGTYAAAVQIEYEGRRATWEGVFTLGDEVQSELAQRQTNRPPRDWLPIVTIAATAVAALALSLLLRERLRGSRGAPAGPGAPARAAPSIQIRREGQPGPPAQVLRSPPAPPPPPPPPPPAP